MGLMKFVQGLNRGRFKIFNEHTCAGYVLLRNRHKEKCPVSRYHRS